jgi:hypothetical protein
MQSNALSHRFKRFFFAGLYAGQLAVNNKNYSMISIGGGGDGGIRTHGGLPPTLS